MYHDNSNAQKRVVRAIQRRYGIDRSKLDKRGGGADKRRPTRLTLGRSSRPTNRGQASQPRQVKPARGKRSRLRNSLVIIVLIILIGIGTFGYKVIAASDKISVADRSILGQIKDLFLNQGNMLAGEQNGRINVVLIAIGGEGHKGENLADTIILVSIDPRTNQAALLSVPRDLYVQVPGREYFSKINAVHAYGESQKTDYGPVVLGELLEKITGQPIHYYVRVDFTAFKNIIDAIGGVNITIENSFFDYWHKISFPAGTEKMNGERALAYVRARYIEGPEGGDFKRAARQQQVLLASREKIFSVQTALDFTRLNNILNSLSDDIRTNMQLWEMKRFYEMARLIDQTKTRTKVLTSGSKGTLTGSTEILGGAPAAVLKPRTGNYGEIQAIATTLLDQPVNPQPQVTSEQKLVKTPSPSPSLTPVEEDKVDSFTIEVRNGTTSNGLAKRTADELAGKGYKVTMIGNAANQHTVKTTVYYAAAEQQQHAQDLAELLNATTSPDRPDIEAAATANILVILGEDKR